MKISHKLLIIVVLTLLEVSITLWAVFEVSKGAKFHQLNSLHLKYSIEFSEHIHAYANGQDIPIPVIENTLKNIRAQPVECLEQVNRLNRFIMSMIGTSYALELCKKDVKDVEATLLLIQQYRNQHIDKKLFVEGLLEGARVFAQNSYEFEKPITETVKFVIASMIPLVVFISLFNVAFITWLSRNITGSINSAIELLKKQGDTTNIEELIGSKVSGELKTLLIEAKKRIESEIEQRQINQALKEKVMQRSKSLKQANEDLAQFAYHSSHDLKGPLVSTKNLSKLILEDIDAGSLEEAKLNTKRVTQLMEKMELLISGIASVTDSKAKTIHKSEVEFKKVFSHIEFMFKGNMQESKYDFHTEINIQSPLISSESCIQDILEKLVDNSIRYLDPNKDKRWVKLSIVENQDTFILSVTDNGCGIPTEKQGNVFKMFQRFSPQSGDGSGLGLAAVNKMVIRLNGRIDFTSNEFGTTFRIIFDK